MFMSPDRLGFQGNQGAGFSRLKTKAINKRICIVEHGAEPRKENEIRWLARWIHQEGIERFLGKIIRLPELALEHAAGRVYLIKTSKRKKFFVVVGYGCPAFYPVKKELTRPKEILGYHRGSGIIAKMKVERLRLERDLQA